MGSELSKPNTRTYYAAHGPDGTTHIGVTEPDQVTTTGQPSFEADADPQAFVGKVQSAGLVSRLPLIPQKGEPVEKDVLYNHEGKAIVCYQSHTRTHFPPEETPALFGLAKQSGDPWVQPTGAHDAYDTGAIVTHAGKTWESTIDANTTEPGQNPAFGFWVEKT